MKIIFIHPKPLKNLSSGSSLRPSQMLNTFKSLGYDVSVVIGARKTRKSLYQNLKKQIKDGALFDYIYVESLSRPTNSRIIGVGPFKMLIKENLDYNFLKFCIKRGMKVGFYLRDLHWDFKEHMAEESLVKRIYLKSALQHFGKKELEFIQNLAIEVFTPSSAFSEYLYSNWNIPSTPLPPGAKLVNSTKRRLSKDKIKLFYVGGLTGVYQPELFLEGVLKSNSSLLTICARPAEHYLLDDFTDSDQIRLVSGEGKDLNPFYDDADIGVYLLPPSGYAKLAHSVKLSEYVAQGLPIIAFQGTYAADLIEEFQIGWTLPYDSAAVPELIEKIIENPENYSEIQQNVIRAQREFSWEKVVERLEKKLLEK